MIHLQYTSPAGGTMMTSRRSPNVTVTLVAKGKGSTVLVGGVGYSVLGNVIVIIIHRYATLHIFSWHRSIGFDSTAFGSHIQSGNSIPSQKATLTVNCLPSVRSIIRILGWCVKTQDFVSEEVLPGHPVNDSFT
jgi:hypothetical protein